MSNSPMPPEQPTTSTEETYLELALNPTPSVGESRTHYLAPTTSPHSGEVAGKVARRRAQPK
ncbi:hypothetical protein [Actinophytocola sp.]|uniref:hypothetical protein n=1 Tax=Actinophytocola sp. TaxID=1872138 RepID=UPI003899D937